MLACLVVFRLTAFVQAKVEAVGLGLPEWPSGVLLLCLQQIPLVEELRGHFHVQMVPIPADVLLSREGSLVRRKKASFQLPS